MARLTLMVAAGVPPFTAAVALGALSNVNGCLTQYGIGSGPVMYGSGYVTQDEWWKAGFIMSLVYLVVWLVVSVVVESVGPRLAGSGAFGRRRVLLPQQHIRSL